MGFHPTPQKYLKRGKIMITAEESRNQSSQAKQTKLDKKTSKNRTKNRTSDQRRSKQRSYRRFRARNT